jgi:hypothetical protein
VAIAHTGEPCRLPAPYRLHHRRLCRQHDDELITAGELPVMGGDRLIVAGGVVWSEED